MENDDVNADLIEVLEANKSKLLANAPGPEPSGAEIKEMVSALTTSGVVNVVDSAREAVDKYDSGVLNDAGLKEEALKLTSLALDTLKARGGRRRRSKKTRKPRKGGRKGRRMTRRRRGGVWPWEKPKSPLSSTPPPELQPQADPQMRDLADKAAKEGVLNVPKKAGKSRRKSHRTRKH